MKIPKTNTDDNRTFQTVGLIALISILSIGNSYADENHHEQLSSTAGAKKMLQTECPVMIGNKIDPNIYTDYKGKRVYFCCNSCKSAFGKKPEKYLGRLPQFKSADISDHDGSSHEHNG